MTPNIVLLVIVGTLYAAGVYMVLERSLTRVLLGLLLMGNATNVLLLASGGAAGNAPIYGTTSIEEMSDPLAQAMILTAIVITLGMAAFMLALIHRRWQLDREDDDVDDDTEDRLVASQMTHADVETHEHTDFFGEGDHR
jgi:multicomponent Na+:H+ antiporter subunit C